MNEPGTEKTKLPFNNLFLNAGAVHGYNYWWMFFFGIGLTIFSYILYQVFLTIPLVMMASAKGFSTGDITSNPNILFDPDKLGVNKNIFLALMLGMFVATLFGLYTAVKRLHKKPFLSIITAYEKLRYKRFFFAFGVWGILLIITTVIGYLMDPGSFTLQFNPVQFSLLLIVSVLLMPIQTSTEEFIFRGYMLQGLSLLFKNGLIPVIITSLLFGLVHMSNPEVDKFGWAIMLPYYSTFGLFLGMLTLLDEGLELAMGIHCANNLISSLLVTSPNGVLKTDAIFAVETEDPGTEFIAWLILAAITFIIFWLKYRWKNFNLILK